ncbi:MAG: nitroreductase family protein [Candidatus Bathyarchaeota archaeon]|nr:nitroreductase family protein [Candidatus Bathyarchaeota archaeon]
MTGIVLDTATKRRTARNFRSDPISEDTITYILETARQAPSGSNTQPWRFIVVTDPEVKMKVRTTAEEGEQAFYETLPPERAKWYRKKGLSPNKPHLTDAPVLLVVLGDTAAPNWKPSVWVAIGYMLLAVEEQGLATVTYTPSDPEKVRVALGVPENFEVQTVLPIGYSADDKAKEERLPLEELVFMNSWGNGTG